jgi:hexokinase
MLYSLKSLRQYSDNLIAEVKKAESGKDSSITLATYKLPTNVQSNIDKYQVISIGGSHLESALVSKEEDQVKIHSFEEIEIPNLNTVDVLMDLFGTYISSKVDKLIVNFAYPIQPKMRYDRFDGVLLRSVKSHALKGLVGKLIGQTIEDYVEQRFSRKIEVYVCNDTFGLGMASLHYQPNFDHTNTIAGVVGTGFNFGIFSDSETFVNLESGNFDKFDSTHSGDCIDALSDNPFGNRFEKEVGGGYLYKHFNLIAREEMLETCISSTRELSSLAETDTGREGQIAQKVLTRAASLVAMQIHALYTLKKDEHNLADDQDFLVLAEGTVLWKAHDFLPSVEDYLDQLCDMDGLDADCIRIEHLDHSGIIGAAHLI